MKKPRSFVHRWNQPFWKALFAWFRALKRKPYEKEKQEKPFEIQAALADAQMELPQAQPDQSATQDRPFNPFKDEKETQSMKTKAVYANVIAKMFEVTPEVVEQRLKNTALFLNPEFEVEMPAEELAVIEKLDIHQLRLNLTSILDAFGISMSKLEKAFKKG